jgi:hypothetical protein
MLLFELAVVHVHSGYERGEAAASAEGPNRSSTEQMRSASFSAAGFTRSYEAAGENQK